MAPLIPPRARQWLARRYELSRGVAASNLRPMEGLRGLAVLLVFLVHYATLVEPWLAPGSAVQRLLAAAHGVGHAGVDLFFLLSGYLIYGHLIARRQAFGRYFKRRLQRIYPAFLAVFAIYTVLSLMGFGGKLPADPATAGGWLLANLLLLPGVFPITPLITVAWSLSYEMLYYLAMPVLIAMFTLRSRSGRWRLGFFTGSMVLALAVSAWAGGPVRLIMFLAGVVLFEAMQQHRARAPGSTWALGALAASLGALLWPMRGAEGQALRVALLSAGFFVLCFGCFGRPQGLAARLFCWTPLRWLGNMSYSYYLLHGLVLKVFFTALAKLAPPAANGRFGLDRLLPTFVLTLAGAALMYLWVERPLSLVGQAGSGTATPAAAAEGGR